MWWSLVISWFLVMCWRAGIQAAEILCNRPNEHYECGSACQTTCATLGTVCPIINIRCNDDCYCNENYARNDNGTCIPIVQCPQNLRSTTISRPGTQKSTTTTRRSCPQNSRTKTISRPGSQNLTTTRRPLLQCNRPNEHYECGSACQTTCATLGTVCPIVNIRCNDDCYCNENYARDGNGTCIPIAQCPQNSTTVTTTRAQNSTTATTTRQSLIQCNRPNEHYECGSACQTTCATLGTVCPIVNIRCNDDCYCNENYARDGNGTCIPIAQCPSNS